MQLIKKNKNGNQYKITKNGMFVRNPFIKNVPYIDINTNLFSQEDYKLIINNEFENSKTNYPWIDTEFNSGKKFLILSDGIGFKKNSKELLKLIPNDVKIIGVNNILKNITRSIHYYLINNPYKDCLNYINKLKYFPRCIFSTRTNPEFLRNYKNLKYKYRSVSNNNFSMGFSNESSFYLDDYRNPICAALNLLFKFDVEKILICYGVDGFKEELPGTSLEDGYYFYNKQNIAREIINDCIFWAKDKEISIGSLGEFHEFKNAKYITLNEITEFFNDE